MGEEKQVKGKIEAISKKENNFYLKIGEVWVSGLNKVFSNELNTMAKGDIAEASYTENITPDRTYCNIVPGKLKITKVEMNGFKPAGENAYAQRDSEKREDILRSVAVKGSLELMNHLMNNAGDSDEVQTKRVLKIADEFLIWLKGEK